VTDPWAPPPNQPNTPQPPAGEPPTQQIPQRGQAPLPPTQQFPKVSPPPEPPTQQFGQQPHPTPAAKPPFFKRIFRDPVSIILVVVIVLAVAVAGVVGAELYARHRGNELVSNATACVVQDTAKASFGASPFLLQWMSGHYGHISIATGGNQIREAKGMKAEIDITDIQLADTGNSKGTIGALDATITWTADGIRQTIQDAIPLVGSFVNGVTTNPSDGTIELKGALGSIIAKPTVADGGVGLEVQQLTGLGFALPRETVQPALDAFTSQLTKNYPLGVHADSVQVTDTGVVSKFSTKNATIPVGQQDPCFAGV
jgi:LmeA-like phospholipid-binding